MTHRRAALAPALALAPLLACAAPAAAQGITDARFADPTPRYDHAILGDALEWGSLILTGAGGTRWTITLPPHQVFEDLAPRLWDVTGDGLPEVVVILTDVARGASLVVIGLPATGAGADQAPVMLAATPHIGQTHRWLAPIGAADLDGDGRIEIAYIDRPHLARILRVWEWTGQGLRPEAELPGLTNHRIGQDFISGGIRDCDQQGGQDTGPVPGPAVITANADWTRIIATTLTDGRLQPVDIGAFTGPASLTAALDCS